jgi:hypothetical protein
MRRGSAWAARYRSGTDLNSTIAAVTRLLPLQVLTPLAKADLFMGRLR